MIPMFMLDRVYNMDREQLLSGIQMQATLWFVTPSAFGESSMMFYVRQGV